MKRKHLLAFMMAGAIALVGCGGGGDDNGGGDGGGSETNGDGGGGAASADAGETLFAGTCASCHGQDATGMEGLGKNLRTSEWVAQQTDEKLAEMINTGRPASHELNTTGVDMPPKGGNPSLSDTDIDSLVLYIRSINTAG